MQTNRVRRAHRVIVTTIVCAGLVASFSGPATSSQFGDLDGDFHCTPLKQVGIKYLLPDGTYSPVHTDKTADIYLFESADGTGAIFPEEELPEGWSPINATDKELDVFGLPPRPTDPQALADWKADWANVKDSAPPGMCQSTTVRHGGRT
jgi:hypothetical protein